MASVYAGPIEGAPLAPPTEGKLVLLHAGSHTWLDGERRGPDDGAGRLEILNGIRRTLVQALVNFHLQDEFTVLLAPG
jgi:hypothetical protein